MANSSMMKCMGGITKFGYRPSNIPFDKKSAGSVAHYTINKQRSYGDDTLLRVRRSSDNNESDISWKQAVNGTMLSFVTAVDVGGSGYVKTWYDINTTAARRPATNITPSQQPMIVDAGQVITYDGDEICYDSSVGVVGLKSTNPMVTGFKKTDPFSIVIKVKINGFSSELRPVVFIGNNPFYPTGLGIGLHLSVFGGFLYFGPYIISTSLLPSTSVVKKFYLVGDGVNLIIYDGDDLSQVGASVSLNSQSFDFATLVDVMSFGCTTDNSLNVRSNTQFNGYISEVIIYNRSLSSTDLQYINHTL